MFNWLRRWLWLHIEDDEDEIYEGTEDSWDDDSFLEDETDYGSDIITDPAYCFLEGNIYHDMCDDHHDSSWDYSFDSHDFTDDWDTPDSWDFWDDSSSSWNDDW